MNPYANQYPLCFFLGGGCKKKRRGRVSNGSDLISSTSVYYTDCLADAAIAPKWGCRKETHAVQTNHTTNDSTSGPIFPIRPRGGFTQGLRLPPLGFGGGSGSFLWIIWNKRSKKCRWDGSGGIVLLFAVAVDDSVF